MDIINVTGNDILIDEDLYEWIAAFSWYVTKNRKGIPIVQTHYLDETNNRRTTTTLARFIYEKTMNGKLESRFVVTPNPLDVYNYKFENLTLVSKSELGKKGGRPHKKVLA